MQTLRTRLLPISLCTAAAFGLMQQAQANLVQNGGFTNNTGTGQVGFNTTLADWVNANNSVSPGVLYYDFVFNSATVADSTGAPSQFNNNVVFWGPDNTSPVANGFTASPAGPSFVAMDSTTGGSVTDGPLSQTINGLTVGHTYALTFYWAAAQQTGYTGPTTDQIAASLGGQSQNTVVDSIPSQGFSGWAKVTMDYTATNTSEVLAFLATGAPSVSDPPFVLLDGVDLEDVTSAPEAASTAMLLGCTGVALAFAARRYGRQSRQQQ